MKPLPALALDGSTLRLADIAVAARRATITVDPVALERVRQNHELAAGLTETQAVYGRTTGVGAGRHEDAGAAEGHGLGLLRSHAAGWGPQVPASTVRAALAIRANQILAGGSGASPLLAQSLASLAAGDEFELPVVHRHGSLGTGDLTTLAEVGLALMGERPRSGGHRRAELALTSADALPLMSSNAFAIAEGALSADELQRLSQSANVVCALSFVALQGNRETVSEAAMTATPFPGSVETAGAVRALVARQPGQPAHIQDFFGLRTWPQAHGPLLDSLRQLVAVVETMANTGSENPLFTAGNGGKVTHHGGFHAAYLALALDSTLLALTRSAQAVKSRVSHLLTDAESAPTLFLSDTTPGSSGLLIAEYVAAAALSLIREAAAVPSSVQTVTLSRGIEDDASFAGHAAARLREATAAYRRILAVELVAAVRAIRMRGLELDGGLGAALDACGHLPAGVEDRDLSADFEVAERIVEGYAALPPGAR